MITYPDNVVVGSVVHKANGDALDVTSVKYRTGHGWEVTTKDAEGYSGPTFSPDGDRMPDPGPNAEVFIPWTHKGGRKH